MAFLQSQENFFHALSKTLCRLKTNPFGNTFEYARIFDEFSFSLVVRIFKNQVGFARIFVV